jgi:hypothetical protein
VCDANSRIGHDLRLVLEGVADVTVLIAHRADLAEILLVFAREILSPLIVVGFPGDMVPEEHVSDAPLRGGRNRERCVGDVVIGVRVAAIAEIPGGPDHSWA